MLELVPGVTKKTLVDPEGSYQKPNEGSKVTVVVTARSADGATVYEADKAVEYTTDEELVGIHCCCCSVIVVLNCSSYLASYTRAFDCDFLAKSQHGMGWHAGCACCSVPQAHQLCNTSISMLVECSIWKGEGD